MVRHESELHSDTRSVIRKAYESIQKKHGLTEFSIVDAELELCSLDSPDFLSSTIRKRLSERVERFLELLRNLIQPEQTLIDMHEFKYVEKEDRKHLFELFQKLMLIQRRAVEADLIREEDSDCAFFRESFDSWMDLKKDILIYVKKAQRAWQDSKEVKERVEYVG